MRKGHVNASCLKADGYRLTGAFHLSEDELALRDLSSLAATSSPLLDVATGRRVFRGPIFKR